MAERIRHRKDGSVMDDMEDERARIHEAYARLGRMGGEKGGQIRKEQMARGEIFSRRSQAHQANSPQRDMSAT